MKKIFCLLFILISCAPTYIWIHPEKTEKQIIRDRAECRNIARMATGPMPAFNPMGGLAAASNDWYHIAVFEDAFNDCMIAKGYERQQK